MILEGKRIFITEDNVANRSIMQLLLEQEGAVVEFERWGPNTPSILQQFAPVDIVLLDLMLPRNITGFDVFDSIRDLPELDGVPIVAVSAKTPDIAIPETQAKGFDGFISKPIDYTKFATQIATLIQGEHLWISR